MVAGNMADDRSTDASVLRVNPRNNSDSAITILSKRNVAYIFNEEYMRLCDELPKVKNRASMTHDLIVAYGLLSQLSVISPRPAREDEITSFHSMDYVECLQTLSSEEDSEKFEEEAEMYGLTYDCPAYPGVYEYAALVSGASVMAARALMLGMADVAINWAGGWHHAKRDEAAGFCYFNDIVIAILKLRQKFDRVLYVDVDLHHGDGVEDAFCTTSKVMTVSFHKKSPGFFPGTGDVSSIGIGKGRFYAVNVPLKDSVQDQTYVWVFKEVMSEVRERFCPDVVVCQCGADGLANDPMDSYNLTPAALGECVQCLLAWQKPVLLLGGGGYNLANTARCWTYLTGLALGQKLPQDIPEHKWFPEYGPDYVLSVNSGNRADQNDDVYLKELIATIKENLGNISR